MKFSQNYFPPQELTTDSEKIRIRLGSYIHSLSFKNSVGNYFLASKVVQEVGVHIPTYLTQFNSYNYDFQIFFSTVEVTTILDALSVIYEVIPLLEKLELRKFVNKCFTEEGLAYLMMDEGSVVFRPDEEFERNRKLTLKNLVNSKYSAALEAFNKAFHEFQTDRSKSKSALRYIFEANEILFKQITKSKFDFSRLTAKNIDSAKEYFLEEKINHPDETAKEASKQLIESYKSWVNALHNYRHGQDVENYDNPPLDLTILALSNGASFLRWMASLEQTQEKIL